MNQVKISSPDEIRERGLRFASEWHRVHCLPIVPPLPKKITWFDSSQSRREKEAYNQGLRDGEDSGYAQGMNGIFIAQFTPLSDPDKE